MPVANVRGAQIHFEVLGESGPWVSISPGGRRGYLEIMSLGRKLAAQGFRVLLHDRRNCGASDVVIEGDESEYEVWADDLYELMRQHDALPAYIGGASSGCRLSLLFALRHPEAVRGLLLWRVTGGEFAVHRLAKSYYSDFIDAAFLGGMPEVCATEFFHERIVANPANGERLLAMDAQRFIDVMDRWRQAFLDSVDLPVIGATEADLRSIAVAALVIPGNDRTHPIAVGENLAQLLPNAELEIVMPEVVDMDVSPPWDAQEDQIASLLVGFMQRVEQGAPRRRPAASTVRAETRAPTAQSASRQPGMHRSTDRILTSHTGSLARPADLIELLRLKVNAEPGFDPRAFAARSRSAVEEIVRLQAESGVDIVDDGELSKPQFADYIADRISGFEGENPNTGWVRSGLRPEPFPAYAEWRRQQTNLGGPGTLRRLGPKCVGPLAWKDRAYETDIANLKAAMAKVDVVEGFLPSPSPGIIISRIPNEYFQSEEEYLFAVADVLRDEYRAIVDAGLVLQIDAPDVAMSWASQYWETMEEFRAGIEMRVEALNHALAGVPEESVRFHICWGNNENPHTMDVELKDIVDIVLKVKAACYSIEASNPRHGHEWTVWETTKLADGKMLMPGVIDSLTNFVEHPELVAQRIVQYAKLVGRENVIAGTDCGFGTGATLNPRVHPEIVWAKFRSLSEGARIASKQLWS